MHTNEKKPIISQNEYKEYPHIGELEYKYVQDALSSGELWGPWGKYTTQLEEEWASRTKTSYCAAVNSGTAALHCALFGCGIGLGDEVIVPAYSFIATATAVIMCGGIPIFVDVNLSTGNIDTSKIEDYITSKTKAIVVVHLTGLPVDMEKVLNISRKYNLKVVEDCAQAHGALYKGDVVGGIGDVGTFSLNATKVLAGPEGGLITTNNVKIFNRAARLRTFGTEWKNNKKLVRNADCLGYNYRTNELASSFAMARLKTFNEEQEYRIKNAKILIDGIKSLPGITIAESPKDVTQIYQMIRISLVAEELCLDMDDREFQERILKDLANEGARWWQWEIRALPEYDLFVNKNNENGGYPWSLSQSRQNINYNISQYPNSVKIGRQSIFTTSHFYPNSEELMHKYVVVFHKIWNNIDQILSMPKPKIYNNMYIQKFT